MYSIVSEGSVVALRESPRYVRLNEASGAWVQAAADDAQAIAARGQLYNMPGSNAVEDAPEAIVVDADITEMVFLAKAQSQTNAASLEDLSVTTETALCDVDETALALDARIEAIETALCDMDAAHNE